MQSKKNSGFSLVELSIVLVIIGLIIGGIMAGQTLLQSSRGKKVLADAVTYRVAMQQFKQQYQYFPGDFPTATEVWGRADGGTPITSNCASPATDTSIDGVATCNGNGNGIMEGGVSENYRAWQQLSAASYITGKYTGVYGPANIAHTIPGTNTPLGALTGTTYFIWSWGLSTGDVSFFAGDYNNVMTFGKRMTNSWPYAGALTSKEAGGIDAKADDGYPGLGNIRTMAKTSMDSSAGIGCVSSDTPSAAQYIMTTNGTPCTLLFMQTFKAPQQ